MTEFSFMSFMLGFIAGVCVSCGIVSWIFTSVCGLDLEEQPSSNGDQ